MKRARIILSVTNDLVTDQRVHKIATSLQAYIGDVLVVGRLLPNSLPLNRDYATHRMRLLFKKGPLFYAEYNIRLFIYLLFVKSNILVANDLDTLPANALISRLKRVKLVYDAHEFFTEVPELVARPRIKKIWQKLETYFIRHVDKAYTVCDSLAKMFEESYNIPFNVVRNIPLLSDDSLTPIKEKGDTILYQGAVNIGRGLELMIDTMAFLPEANLIIAGGGDILEALKKSVKEKKMENQITFLGRMPFEQLKNTTQLADVGISIEEDLGLNYRFALPNKVFDYIHCGKPILVSNLPEMSKVVTDYKVGNVLYNRSPKALSEAINTLLLDTDLRKQCYANAQIARQELNWQQEEKTLITIYRQILD